MRYKSSLALPAFSNNYLTGRHEPAELDYEALVELEDDGSRLHIKSAYIPELDLKLASHQLTHADKYRLISNIKFH